MGENGGWADRDWTDTGGSLPQPPIPAPPRQEPGDAPEGRGSKPRALLIGLTLLAALVAGICGSLLLLGGSDEQRPGPADRAPDVTSTASASESVAASAPPAEPTVSATFRCWSGDMTTGPELCPALSGKAAFRWVFPGSRGCEVVPAPTPPRVRAVWCNAGTHLVHFAQWDRWNAMNRYYESESLRGIELRPDLLAAEVDPGTGTNRTWAYKLAAWYQSNEAPWSVTVYTSDAASARRIFDSLGMRPVDRLAGDRVG